MSSPATSLQSAGGARRCAAQLTASRRRRPHEIKTADHEALRGALVDLVVAAGHLQHAVRKLEIVAQRVLLAEIRKTQPSAAADAADRLRPKHRIRKLERPRKSSRTGPHAVNGPAADV